MSKFVKELCITVAISGLPMLVKAQGTTYVGYVNSFLAQPSPISTSTQTRVSIITASPFTTACPTSPGTYSFDLSNAGLTSAYEAILLTAVASGTQVKIDGSGVCDAAGIEEVQSMWLL